MTTTRRKVVGIAGGGSDNVYQLLFSALEGLYPVECRHVPPADHRGLDALIVLDGDTAQGVAAAANGLPCLVVAQRAGSLQAVVPGEVRFGSSEVLDACLRNQMMAGRGTDHSCALTAEPGDEVVASRGAQPVWLARRQGKGTCQISSSPLPVVREKEFLFQHLNGDGVLQLLPLMNFACQLVKELDWQSPRLPACFVFDDPSPYLPSYGHLDFRLLAEQATKHGFFASVAMIPLDTCWFHREVAETFRRFSPRLSVIIHGNGHTKSEMLAEHDGSAGRKQAAQALRRMERLQQRHGVEFIKIMEPPHGAITEAMFPHLLALGYEAVLGTRELLVRHNPGGGWPAGFGLDRSQFLGGGLPVIPRIKMSPGWRNDVLLAAFLGQPIVIAMHHWDLADGYELLVEVAEMINRLKVATWTSPLGIIRSNYTELRRGDELNIKVYSRKFHLTIPPGVKSLTFHRPWLQGASSEDLVMHQSDREVFHASAAATLGPMPVESPCELDVFCPPPNPIDHRNVPAPRFNPWPVLRKILMETRDRSSPLRCQTMRLLRGSAARMPANNDED